jgi:hypothetical protein
VRHRMTGDLSIGATPDGPPPKRSLLRISASPR